tara:strand:+ start:18167 stop:18607 length:441 start_codon:yes stop_codon:yes gene_type:complete
MVLALSEIVDKAISLKTKEEKVEWLEKNKIEPLKQLLSIMYNKKKYTLMIPSTAPPYTPSEYPDSQGMLYREMRKMRYFIKEMEADNLTQYRRESLFIQMLESVDAGDAKLLCQMLSQKPLKGLTAKVLNEVFGEDFVEIKKSKEK